MTMTVLEAMTMTVTMTMTHTMRGLANENPAHERAGFGDRVKDTAAIHGHGGDQGQETDAR